MSHPRFLAYIATIVECTRQGRRQQLVRGRAGVGSTKGDRLIGDERVAAVDIDLVLEALPNRRAVAVNAITVN